MPLNLNKQTNIQTNKQQQKQSNTFKEPKRVRMDKDFDLCLVCRKIKFGLCKRCVAMNN